MMWRIGCLGLLGLSVWFSPLQAAPRLFAPSPLEHLQIQLEYDRVEIDRNRRKVVQEHTDGEALFYHITGKPPYLPALLHWQLPESEGELLEAAVRSRGRHRQGHCDDPPLKLRWPKDSALYPSGGGIKLVTHCKADPAYRRNAQLEGWIYRLVEAIGPYALRTQPAELEYRDSKGQTPAQREWGLLLEPPRHLAARQGWERLPPSELKPLFADARQFRKRIHEKALTQAMAVNYLFGKQPTRLRQNMQWFRQDGQVICVRYDFNDLPAAWMPEQGPGFERTRFDESVAEATPRGWTEENACLSPAAARRAVAFLQQRQTAMEAVLRTMPAGDRERIDGLLQRAFDFLRREQAAEVFRRYCHLGD